MKSKKWLKQIAAIAFSVCLVFVNVPISAFAAPDDAIYLETAEDVLKLAEDCISDSWSQDKVVVLKNDIDMSGTGFEGIPTFGGTFSGQGFTISGCSLIHQQNAMGFFRYLQKSAVVEDLHLKGRIQPSQGDNYSIGALAGVNRGIIKNCSFEGIVSGTERIGGIVGLNKVSGVIEGCQVTGSVYGDHYVGGVAGENLGVIRKCVNHAEVNTHVSHNSVSASISSEISLDGLNLKESMRDATNLGGIAGTSSGVIRDCENHAAVGYEKMGYNVGGIAGSQIGYITESINYGVINGSNGVGGVVGQFKPNVVLNMGENHMSTLMDQMIDMMNSMNGMMDSMDGMTSGLSTDMGNLEESMDVLKDWDPNEIEIPDQDSIDAAINDMSSSFNSMYQDMTAKGNEMKNQMSGMMDSMGEMVGTMEKLNEGLNINIVDISKNDTAADTVAKIHNCSNYGQVHGETYVGGITGIADIEDTSAKEDAEGEISFSTEGEMIMRLVIRDCKNIGNISASKQYAGGIVGNMIIGAVFGSENIGSMDAGNADYVGGIAGSSETYIKDSVSRSVLTGKQYVGGIAGYGTEVLDCYAISKIEAFTKFAGGILGYASQLPDEQTSLIANNKYYLAGENVGGVDGISYNGATNPISIEMFLAAENMDEMFRTVTVRFAADGMEDVVETLGLNETLSVAEIPVLDVEEHEEYQWVFVPSVSTETLMMDAGEETQYISQERLTNILFDQTYEAVFDAKNMVIATEEKTASGRSLALAVGTFDRGVTMSLTNMADETFTEAWEVNLSDIGVEKLHYHMPEDVTGEEITLYVKDCSGNWNQREFTVEGSYIIFDFAHGESAFALEVNPASNLSVVTIVIAAAAILILGVVVKSMKKRKTDKKGNASE